MPASSAPGSRQVGAQRDARRRAHREERRRVSPAPSGRPRQTPPPPAPCPASQLRASPMRRTSLQPQRHRQRPRRRSSCPRNSASSPCGACRRSCTKNSTSVAGMALAMPLSRNTASSERKRAVVEWQRPGPARRPAPPADGAARRASAQASQPATKPRGQQHRRRRPGRASDGRARMRRSTPGQAAAFAPGDDAAALQLRHRPASRPRTGARPTAR